MMSEKSTDLTAIIAGIRSHKGKEDEYIASCLRDIRREIRIGSRSEKSEAALKLSYLHLLGYNAAWASFSIVEVMSNSALSLKRPGFFACAISFTGMIDMVLLHSVIIYMNTCIISSLCHFR